MRRWIGILLLGAACGTSLFASPEGQTAVLRIDYMGFSETVRLDKAVLEYFFRQNTPTGRGARLELSADKLRLFEDWAERCGVFSLKNPDVLVGDPNHPGAQEFNHFQVMLGGQNVELSWTGVSVWNNAEVKTKLDKAIDELTKMCFRIMREAGLIDIL